jgi:hypothetical protein
VGRQVSEGHTVPLSHVEHQLGWNASIVFAEYPTVAAQRFGRADFYKNCNRSGGCDMTRVMAVWIGMLSPTFAVQHMSRF